MSDQTPIEVVNLPEDIQCPWGKIEFSLTDDQRIYIYFDRDDEVNGFWEGSIKIPYTPDTLAERIETAKRLIVVTIYNRQHHRIPGDEVQRIIIKTLEAAGLPLELSDMNPFLMLILAEQEGSKTES